MYSTVANRRSSRCAPNLRMRCANVGSLHHYIWFMFSMSTSSIVAFEWKCSQRFQLHTHPGEPGGSSNMQMTAHLPILHTDPI
jgi:hypothetical protein